MQFWGCCSTHVVPTVFSLSIALTSISLPFPFSSTPSLLFPFPTSPFPHVFRFPPHTFLSTAFGEVRGEVPECDRGAGQKQDFPRSSVLLCLCGCVCHGHARASRGVRVHTCMQGQSGTHTGRPARQGVLSLHARAHAWQAGTHAGRRAWSPAPPPCPLPPPGKALCHAGEPKREPCPRVVCVLLPRHAGVHAHIHIHTHTHHRA